MNLDRIQREMFDVVRTPLTNDERTRQKSYSGRSTKKIADAIIAPNDRLTSLERLEIYNRQYWFRIIGALTEDFPGVRAIVGDKRFERIAHDYLNQTGSHSFTLRNLGSKLPQWLARHRSYIRGVETLAIEMAKLEWAEIETFDGADEPILKVEDLSTVGANPFFLLQPYIQLLELSYPADDVLLTIRRKQDENSFSANAVMKQMRRTRITRVKLPKSREGSSKIYLAVHRHDFSVYFKRVDREAFALLREFQKGSRLSQAIGKVRWGKRSADDVAADVRQWFTTWASLGWFVAAPKGKRKEGL